MKTNAVRLYGKEDIRLEEFELPELGDDEILAEVVTDSLCVSTYKAITQAEKHKKVPGDIAEHPIIVGHEFCGVIRRVGKKWADKYNEGDKFVIQPNIGDKRGYAPGYSFRYMGGDATFVIFSNQVMENGSLLQYNGESFFEGSLVEPLSCVVGAFNAQYHIREMYTYDHVMGVKKGGNMALLGATGPMGFLAIDFALHGPRRPAVLVVTGRTQSKLDLAARLYTEEEAERQGVKLIYVNTKAMEDIGGSLREFTEGGSGFDDVFIFASDKSLVNAGAKLLAYDGCLNFFSGPADKQFSAEVNFYDVHYNSTHFVGTSGGNTEDMRQSIELIEKKIVDVSKIVTHILGLDQVPAVTKLLPAMTGGKKVVYTHRRFPLLEIDKIDEMGDNSLIDGFRAILKKNGNFWSREAEHYFLSNAPKI